MGLGSELRRARRSVSSAGSALGRAIDPTQAFRDTRDILGGQNAGDVLQSRARSYEGNIRGGLGHLADSQQTFNKQLAGDHADLNTRIFGDKGLGWISDEKLNTIKAAELGKLDLQRAEDQLHINAIDTSGRHGLINSGERKQSTRDNAEAWKTAANASSMIAGMNIPYVSWAAVVANAIANGRLSEADVIDESDAYKRFAGTFAARYMSSDMSPLKSIGSGVTEATGSTAAGGAAQGASAGAAGAAVGGGNRSQIGQGAIVGGVSGGLQGSGNWAGDQRSTNAANAVIRTGVRSGMSGNAATSEDYLASAAGGYDRNLGAGLAAYNASQNRTQQPRYEVRWNPQTQRAENVRVA